MDPYAKLNSMINGCNSPSGQMSYTLFGRILILAPVSRRDRVKVLPPISQLIMGASGSRRLRGSVLNMIELMVSLIWIRFGFLVGVQSPFKNLAYDGIC